MFHDGYDGRSVEGLLPRRSSGSARAGSGGDGHDGLGSQRVAPAAVWMLLLVAALAIGLVGCTNSPSAASTAPTISSLSQGSGAVGTSVTISGTNYGATQGTSTVTFNGTAVTAVTSWSATSIVVTVPTGATTGNVVVTVSSVASNGVNYVVPAIITSLSQTSGAVGASITITGTNFGATQLTSTVTFNGTAAAAASAWSATSITVIVPVGATTGNVVVTVSGVASNGSPFTVAPGITSLAPNSGAIGATITIAGTNFGAAQGGSTVTFDGLAAVVSTWSASSIVVTVPAGAVTGSVVVTVGGLASTGVTFTVTPVPAITLLTPNAGAVGATVTITGTNFGTTQGASTVTFGGIPVTSVTSWSAVSVVVKVPTGASTGNVILNAAGVASVGVPFTVTPAPAITSLAPSTGAVGASVIIAGTNFGATQVAGSTVTFGGTAATAVVTNWSASSITVTVPAGATTGNVVVNAAGVASNPMTFTVTPTPAITSLLPNTGAIGASVVIAGTNFGATQGASTVTFNNTAVTAVANWSASSITVTVPVGATTGNVVVNAAGVASNPMTFTVTPAPAITTLTPNAGAIGASVVIAGTNFGATQVAGSTVTFGGISATVGTWGPISITVTVPAGASTGNVVVSAAGVASTGSPFTVTAAPAITLLSQNSGAVGTSITITGTNFGATQVAGSMVSFGPTTAPVTSWSATSIVVPVPVGATTGSVVVTVAGVPSNGFVFTVAPVLTTLTPSAGPIGASITIAGSNFGTSQGGSTVTFGGVSAGVAGSWNGSSITVTVPSGATTGSVVVTVGAQASNPLTFTVTPAPVITTLSQNSGAVGTAITITGTNFGATQVAGSAVTFFNSTPATVTTWSDTSILVSVPSGATTGNVVVNVAGVASNGLPFTVTANCTNNCVISGTVNGPWVASVTVTLSGGPSSPAPTTTDASGAYSFTSLMAGTYTVTPSLPGYTYSPAAPAVVATAGATQNFTASSVITTYSISGTITYASGLHTGNTIIRVYQSGTCMNCSPQAGTSLSAALSSTGTAYTVRGLPSGMYVVNVEIDTQGTGVPNSANPNGTSGVATITSSNLTAVNVTVGDRTPAAPSAPTTPSVFPSSMTALMAYNEVYDTNGEELATSYKVSYGTDTAASNLGTASYPAGDQNDVVVVGGLTNGTAYYFKLAAVNGSGTSAYSSVVGPITINATSGGNAVSGTVTFSGITAKGGLLVGLFSGANGVYFTSFASPVSPQLFSISGIPNGSYSLFAILDQHNCGYICVGDVTNFGPNGPPQINVTGTSSGNAITLTQFNAAIAVTTQHTTGGGSDSYNVNVGIVPEAELPISMTLYSAPGVGVPFDMNASSQNDYNAVINNSVSPTVGDPYEFQVTFSNASTQIIPASVTEVLTTFARSVSETTSGMVGGVTLSRNVPEFTWLAPSPLPTSTYVYQVQVSTNNGQIWNYKGGQDGNGLPSTVTSAVFNSDSSASQGSLTTGTAYTVSITVTDNSGNSATIQTSYTP